VRECDVDILMIAGRYTLLDREAGDELLPLAHERGVSIVAAAPYNSGLLSKQDVPSTAMYQYAQAPPELIGRARAMAALCATYGVSLPDAAVQFPLRHPAVVSVVVGMRTAEQVTSTVERFESAIPEDLWKELDTL
jgi:D-threo-aldose 1-dehydrogenase